MCLGTGEWKVVGNTDTESLLSHPGCLDNVHQGGDGGNLTTCHSIIEFLDDPSFNTLYKENPLMNQKS